MKCKILRCNNSVWVSDYDGKPISKYCKEHYQAREEQNYRNMKIDINEEKTNLEADNDSRPN